MAPRRAPSEFLLPDGRKVLVVLPDHVEALRQQYASEHNTNPPVQVEVVVHGSDEHREYLRQSKSHHETRRAQLRDRLGPEVVDELDDARAQLDALETQLQKIEAAAEENGARLNPNFSKFGFHAKLRTFSDEEEGEGGDGVVSSAVSSYSVATEGESGATIKLFKRPVIKQYFHRGLLWRSAENTEVMSFELFFDLLYVGIIAINGDHAAEEADGHELLRFVVTFAMSWRIWSDVQQVVSWFETDDILQRVQFLFLTACLLGHTTNILQAFSEGQDSFTQLVAFYLAARFFTAIYYAVTALLLPLVKGMMIAQVLNILIGAAFWIASTTINTHGAIAEATALTPALEHRETTEAAEGVEGAHGAPLNATRLVLVFIALAIDLFGSAVPVFLFRYATSQDSSLARRIAHFFEFFPAINIEHKVERTNAFVSLVFGYSVVGIMFQNTGVFPLNAFLGKAILGLTQAAVFNWLYFEVDGSNIRMHAIRKSAHSSVLWHWSHLVFSMAYILAAAGLCKMVVLTDCPNAPLDGLTEFYQHRSAETMPLGLRLYYCVGLGLALFCMGLISLSHDHKVPAGMCRLPKWARLANRFAVCVVFFCLPAAQGLNSLNVIAITTSLTVWTLFFELWAKSCRTESFFGEDKECNYTARCSRRRLDGATKDNGEIDIVELGRAEKTAAPTVA